MNSQLGELYGPLYFLVIQGRQTWMDVLESLRRDYVFAPGNELPDHELNLWLFWVEHDRQRLFHHAVDAPLGGRHQRVGVLWSGVQTQITSTPPASSISLAEW